MNILLAEDDPNIAVIVRIVLERIGGHQVTIASDGEQALKTASDGKFDLILLDGMMPKKNGVSVCREYRENGGRTPVIFLSAKSQQSDIDEFLNYGIGYIQKPFDPSTVCNLINDILQARGAAA